MLKYTGHPLVDVGAATILAFSKKSSLSDLTEKDLDKVADYIESHYVVNPLKSFLNVAFVNSGFTQPAFEKTPERRVNYARRVARAYKKDVPVLEERCVFTGEPAVAIALGASEKDDYPLGRAFRHNIPMLTGEDVINFHPSGDAGMPVSGLALLCIQALPMGCAKCGGKLLAVHSDNPELIYKFAWKFLAVNRKQIDLAREAGSSKLPEAGSTAKTMLIETLIEIEQARRDEQMDQRLYSVTAYHLTNSGQSNPLDARNPPLTIYHLPLELTGFLAAITHVEYKGEWQAIERRAWQMTQSTKTTAAKAEKPKKGKAKKEATAKENTRPRRNFLYEDLFRLPRNAPQFIRRYFLRIPIRNTYEDDPRRGYSLKGETELVKWKLTQLFLERVMHMNASRIQRVREMGDLLATYVYEENDQKFFATFYAEQRRYDVIRNALIKVNHARLKRGLPPVVKFDPYLEVFEDVDENGRSDWRLARDLVLIRMIERLYELKWIEQHPDALPDVNDESATE